MAQRSSCALLVASGAVPEALGLLERLLRATDKGNRKGSAIEILVQQALDLSRVPAPVDYDLPRPQFSGASRSPDRFWRRRRLSSDSIAV